VTQIPPALVGSRISLIAKQLKETLRLFRSRAAGAGASSTLSTSMMRQRRTTWQPGLKAQENGIIK